MSDSERIAALEQELAQLRAAFAEYGREHQNILGQAQAFDAAVVALIESHPEPDFLEPALKHYFAQDDADCVARSNNEERLQGLQDAQRHLLGALQNLRQRWSKRNNPT